MRSALDMTANIAVARSLIDAKRVLRQDLFILTICIAFQLGLGLLFGHKYDTRIFMAAGHQVAAGQNPYASADLSAVFQDPGFQDITTIGYPPPWPLMLGGIYRVVDATNSGYLIYNLAIKIPIILANIALAFLTAACLLRLGAGEASARKVRFWLLFNPFLLFASVAWGQFDSIVTCLALASLLLLDSRKIIGSAVLLALAFSFKPTALPLLLVPFFFLGPKSLGSLIRFYLVLLLSMLAFCVSPFVLLGWDPSPILQNSNAHFSVGGGLSPLAALELISNSYQLTGNWWLLGLVWIPALMIACFFIKPEIIGFTDLLRVSTAFIMVFFLTRAWLSEPNIILILPFVLILTTLEENPKPWLHAIWILPLIFSVVNTSAAQLLFPSYPRLMNAILVQMEEFRTARLVAKLMVVLPWQVIGWMIVVRMFKRHSVVRAAAAV